MTQPGDSWQVRIDPLSIRAVALRLGRVVFAVACLIAGGNRAWALSPLFLMLLAESSVLQIVIANGVLTIRSWPDRWSGRLGIVRTLGPEYELVFRFDGTARLVGPDPTAVPLPMGSLMRGWYKRKLTEACLRAGAGVVDQTGDWLRDHPVRSRM